MFRASDYAQEVEAHVGVRDISKPSGETAGCYGLTLKSKRNLAAFKFYVSQAVSQQSQESTENINSLINALDSCTSQASSMCGLSSCESWSPDIFGKIIWFVRKNKKVFLICHFISLLH